MSKLSEPMIEALRAIASAGEAGMIASGRTVAALQRRHLIRVVGMAEGDSSERYGLTPSGVHTLAVLDEIERTNRERAERLSRPVPVGAFVEPSARTAPVLGHEYEDETPDECPAQLVMPDRAPYSCDLDAGHEGDHRGTNGTAVAAWDGRSPYATLEGASEITAERKDGAEFKPAESVMISAGEVPTVPESWIRQLVVLLDAGGRIVKTDRGWRVDQRAGSAADAFLYMWDRLDVTVSEAIRLGIAQALPPTPGRGVVRLALVKN